MAALSVQLREKWFAPVGDAPAKLALAGITLTAEAGETVAVTGPSGCGKSTLLNIIAGLDNDFDGRLELSPGMRVAYVFQEPRLLPWRTVEDNLRLVLDDTPEAAARVHSVLSEIGLEGAARVFASRLSLGMARRVALARAFVIRPDVLLLDEPFVSVDEATARRLRLLLLDLLAAHATTAIFVTHQMREAVMLADRVLVFSPSPGRPVADVPIELDPADRRDEDLVENHRLRLLAADGPFARWTAGGLETGPGAP